MPWQVFKDDFEKLCRAFAIRAEEISKEAKSASRSVESGLVADYFEFLSTSIAAVGQNVEGCEVPSFEEWHRRTHEVIPVIVPIRDLEDL